MVFSLQKKRINQDLVKKLEDDKKITLNVMVEGFFYWCFVLS